MRKNTLRQYYFHSREYETFFALDVCMKAAAENFRNSTFYLKVKYLLKTQEMLMDDFLLLKIKSESV